MINYHHIAEAEDYYQALGYQRVDVPWVVPREPYEATFPHEFAMPYFTLGGFLVASGEQSFLNMLLTGELEEGKWQCTTPCFRDEPQYDELHHPWFMKVELIHVGLNVSHRVLADARGFFEQYLRVDTVGIDYNQVDIVDYANGVELGSYGFREYKGKKWTYGTGVAEPRLSTVLRTGSSAG